MAEQEVQPVPRPVHAQCLGRVACEGSHGGLSYLDPPQLLPPSLMRAQQMEELSWKQQQQLQEQSHQVERISPAHDPLSSVCSALRKTLRFLGEPPLQSPAQTSKSRRQQRRPWLES